MENKEKLVKVKYVTGRNRWKVIEVREDEVEQVREINRMTWRELKKEERKRKRLQESGINICSLEALAELEEDIGCVGSDDSCPVQMLIRKEERENLSIVMGNAIAELEPRQQEMVDMIYFQGKSQDEVAEYFKISKSAVSHAMERIYARLKKIFTRKINKN